MQKCLWFFVGTCVLVLGSRAWAQSDKQATEAGAQPVAADGAAILEPQPLPPENPAPPAPPAPTSGLPPYFQPGLLMQGWVVLDRVGETTTSTARLRRAEVYAKGKVIPNRVSYLVMFDLARVLEPKDTTIKVDNQDPAATNPAKPESVKVKQSKGAVSALQDYYMQFETEYADIYFGQFKIPVSFEGSQTPAHDLLMPDRSTPTTYFDDRRDTGFKVTKKFKYLRYTAAVFNGAGQGVLDNNNAKDVALRLDFFPVEGVGLGAVAYYTLAQVRHKAANDRYEADFHVEVADFNIQAEYMQSHIAKDGVIVDGRGGYAMAAYRIAEVFRPVVRVSYLDPNLHANLAPKTQADLDEYWQYEAGLTYYLMKNTVKLQATVGRTIYDDATVKKPANQAILEAQIWY